MARSRNPNSANSQFFIMFEEGYFLNGQYTVVGRVIEGMDVVDQIKRGRGANGAVLGTPDKMTRVTPQDPKACPVQLESIDRLSPYYRSAC